MFKPVAQVADIVAGRGLRVELEGLVLAVFQAEGAYYAIDNRCPHAEAQLAEGDLQGTTVYCPWHGWAFDVTTGQCRQGTHVRSYPTRVQGSELQVDVSQDGEAT